jgi:hypothetical protein
MPLHVDHVLTIDQLPQECIHDCGAGSGDKSEDVEAWRRQLGFTVDREKATRCLLGYGAWDKDELAAMSDDDIAERILWIACGDFNEWDGTEDSPAGSDIFCLE